MKKFIRNSHGNLAFAGWEIIPDYAGRQKARRWMIGREDEDILTDDPEAWIKHSAETLWNAKQWVEDQCTACPGDIPLQLYGHQVNVREELPLVLHEATICSSANGLRKLAQHLLDAADDMDRMGEDFDHVHFQPHSRPEIVICRFSPEIDRPIVWDETLEGFKHEPA